MIKKLVWLSVIIILFTEAMIPSRVSAKNEVTTSYVVKKCRQALAKESQITYKGYNKKGKLKLLIQFDKDKQLYHYREAGEIEFYYKMDNHYIYLKEKEWHVSEQELENITIDLPNGEYIKWKLLKKNAKAGGVSCYQLQAKVGGSNLTYFISKKDFKIVKVKYDEMTLNVSYKNNLNIPENVKNNSKVLRDTVTRDGVYYTFKKENGQWVVYADDVYDYYIKNLTIADSVIYLGESYPVAGITNSGNFNYLSNLKSVTIEASHMNSLPKQAFSGCAKLKQIIIKSEHISNVGKQAFSNIDIVNASVTVPASCWESYKNLFSLEDGVVSADGSTVTAIFNATKTIREKFPDTKRIENTILKKAKSFLKNQSVMKVDSIEEGEHITCICDNKNKTVYTDTGNGNKIRNKGYFDFKKNIFYYCENPNANKQKWSFTKINDKFPKFTDELETGDKNASLKLVDYVKEADREYYVLYVYGAEGNTIYAIDSKDYHLIYVKNEYSILEYSYPSKGVKIPKEVIKKAKNVLRHKNNKE